MLRQTHACRVNQLTNTLPRDARDRGCVQGVHTEREKKKKNLKNENHKKGNPDSDTCEQQCINWGIHY